MKKINTYLVMALMVVLTMTTFSSCDKDTRLAMDLNGIWSGTIVGDYYVDRYSGVVREDVYDTEICFYQDGDFSKGGTGYQIDRNRDTRQYTRFNFDWTVRNQRIYIRYNDGYEIVIRDYDIYDVGSTMHFSGIFDDAIDGTPTASFNLVKVSNMRSVADEEGAVEVTKEEFK